MLKMSRVDPKSKEVLTLLGIGTFLAASVIFPGLPIVAKGIFDIQKDLRWQKNQKQWNKYNLWRLRQVIKRLQRAKYVEITEINGVDVVSITEKGKKKLLAYNIDNIRLDETRWDGVWRLIIYDVVRTKRANSEAFRRSLLKLHLLKLQKSVYLTPFKCENKIEYLRQIYDIGNEVQILKVGKLENEGAYKQYFGL